MRKINFVIGALVWIISYLAALYTLRLLVGMWP